jgi:hypothetical protein
MTAAEQDLAAEAAERGISVPTLIRIKELVAEAPPLSAETKARLAILLRPHGENARRKRAA